MSPQTGDSPQLQRARDLVMQHGWNATAYQIINPGMTLWFSAAGDAVIGFVPYRRVRVVAGAPVCSRERLREVAAEFEDEAARAGFRVCYFGAEARVEALHKDSPRHSLVLLGAQPTWHPRDWPKTLANHASLRAQLNRAHNKGVSVDEWPAAEVADHAELRRCLKEWLATRGLPPLHFLIEPETLSHLSDRKLFVARQAGEVVGFLVASPVPQRHGWLVEQIVRGRRAPNGTAELLIDAAVRAMASDGFEFVTMGLAPLSRRAKGVRDNNPRWLRFVLGRVRDHGRRFYNFEGLDNFKAKFQPERWDPVYAIVNEPRFSLSMLYAIAGAFGRTSPLALVARAIFRGVATEARWLWNGGLPEAKSVIR